MLLLLLVRTGENYLKVRPKAREPKVGVDSYVEKMMQCNYLKES